MTSGTFDTHKAVVLERLLNAWSKSPIKDFGAFLYEACGGGPDRLTNDQLCETVERYVLMGPPLVPADEADTIPEPITDARRTAANHWQVCYHDTLRSRCPICSSGTTKGKPPNV